jgi:hypothetical protein
MVCVRITSVAPGRRILRPQATSAFAAEQAHFSAVGEADLNGSRRGLLAVFAANVWNCEPDFAVVTGHRLLRNIHPDAMADRGR